MKIKCLLLTALLLAVTTIGFAQAKKPTAATTAATPEQIIKDLYEAQKSERTSPFFQTKNRASLDKFFTKEFADAIFNDAVTANGEIGAIEFDPLTGTQDETKPASVMVQKQRAGTDEIQAIIPVTFTTGSEVRSVDFEVIRGDDKAWKISNIMYADGEDLAAILRLSQFPEEKKLFDALTFKGDYKVGAMRCDVYPTSSMMFYQVHCGSQKKPDLYAEEGDENQTSYIYTDLKTNKTQTFTFKKDQMNGTFTGFDGKTVIVERVAAEMRRSTASLSYGKLEVGKKDSALVYISMETGDAVASCFANDSEVAKQILAVCKDGDECEVNAVVDAEFQCKVEGLENTLSASGKILSVISVVKMPAVKKPGKK